MTEVRQDISQSFLLSADDLKKLCELIISRINAIQNNTTQDIKLEVAFKDGYQQKFNLIDEVLQLDNEGDKQIQEIKIEMLDKYPGYSYKISIEFKDVSRNFSNQSIRYYILGEDPNWVFLTESQIKQKLAKIEIWRLTEVLDLSSISYILLSSLFLILLILMINRPNNLSQIVQPLESLESDYKKGKIKDPIEAIILLEKLKLKAESNNSFNLNINYGWIASVVLLIIGIIASIYCFPVYNFYWGDYIKEYRKKTSIGYTILVVVLLGIIIAVFSNWLSKNIGI